MARRRTASVLLAAFITVIHSFRLDARLVVPRQRLPLACDVRASADDDSSAIGNDGSGGMLPPSEMERLQARIAKIQESGMASPSEKLFELATRETPSSLMRSFFATTSPEISQAMQDASERPKPCTPLLRGLNPATYPRPGADVPARPFRVAQSLPSLGRCRRSSSTRG